MKKTLLALHCLVCSLASTQALTIITALRSPGECPKHLQITAEPGAKDAKFVTVSVRFKPDEPDPYKSRVKADCHLSLIHNGETLFRSGLKTDKKDGFTTCRFRLHKDSMRESVLTVSSSLFEKDGHPTIGGGVIYEIPLKGWMIPRENAERTSASPGIEIELDAIPAIPGR